MYRLSIALIFMFFAMTFTTQAAAQDLNVFDGTEFKVTKVVNGHEVEGKLDDGTRVTVRVMGIDCQSGSQGKSAQRQASKLLKKKKVTLEGTRPAFPLALDNHGRVVAYVRVDDSDFSASMLEAGECTTATWNLPHPRGSEYASLSK